jgi:hypothetical protein
VKAILQYAFYGEDAKLSDPALKAMLVPVRKLIDVDHKKYQEKVERMNEARNQNEIRQKSDRNHSENRQKTDKNQNEIMSDNDNDNDNDKDKKKNTKKKSRSNIHDFPERRVDYESLENEIPKVQEHKLL